MHFPVINNSLSRLVFDDEKPKNVIDWLGYSISYLPTCATQGLGKLAGGINKGNEWIDTSLKINQADSIILKALKFVGMVLLKASLMVFGGAACLLTGAVCLALCPIDIIGIAIRTIGMPSYISKSVTIDAPVTETWSVASKSDNARKWSVYFHHISALPSKKPNGPVDGQPGSKRMCYCFEDEKGVKWKEKVVTIEPNKYRKIQTYKLTGFNIPMAGFSEYYVDQFYKDKGNGKSELTFGTYMKEPESIFKNPINLLKWAVYPIMKLGYIASARREVGRVFQVNLENIGALVEAQFHKKAYVQPHPYLLKHSWDA